MYERLNRFRESKENREKIKPFEQLGLEYSELLKRYTNTFEECEAFVIQNTSYKKYAKGGECLHLGAISPSNLDMVVGGCNRGRILKCAPKGIFSYEYFFDANNRPICSKNYDLNSKDELVCYEIEFLLYVDNTVLGLCFGASDHSIRSISKCLFEKDVMIKYERAMFPGIYIRENAPELSIEIPRYENRRIVSLEWQHFSPPLGLTIKEYNFSIDSDGLLSTYKVKQLYGYKPDFDYGDNPPENWVYHVFKSCKTRTHFDLSQGWIGGEHSME